MGQKNDQKVSNLYLIYASKILFKLKILHNLWLVMLLLKNCSRKKTMKYNNNSSYSMHFIFFWK